MTTTVTRMMCVTLLTSGVGTTEVEDTAFRMVRETAQRSSGSDKFSKFRDYSGLNKRDKVTFLVNNRDEEIVKGLLEVKIK